MRAIIINDLVAVTSAITVTLLENSVDVTETAGSIDFCVNITFGNVESSAYVRYSTISGSATGMCIKGHQNLIITITLERQI